MKQITKIGKAIFLYGLILLSIMFLCGIDSIINKYGNIITVIIFAIIIVEWAVVYYTYSIREILTFSGYLRIKHLLK